MAPRLIRWSLLATGGICKTFTKDLLIDPKTRGVEDIVHVVAAVASSSKASPCVRIHGQDGEIQVFGTSYRPTRIRVIYRETSKPSQEEDFEFLGGTHGMSWEADEAARCWLAGKMESEVMSWEESLGIMRTMDKVRGLCDLRFPDAVESVECPIRMGKRDLNKHVQTRIRE